MVDSLNVTQETNPTKIIYHLIDDFINGPSGEVQCCQSFTNASKRFDFLKIFYPCHIYMQGKQKLNNHSYIIDNHM
jgi:hypothetical protein